MEIQFSMICISFFGVLCQEIAFCGNFWVLMAIIWLSPFPFQFKCNILYEVTLMCYTE